MSSVMAMMVMTTTCNSDRIRWNQPDLCSWWLCGDGGVVLWSDWKRVVVRREGVELDSDAGIIR